MASLLADIERQRDTARRVASALAAAYEDEAGEPFDEAFPSLPQPSQPAASCARQCAPALSRAKAARREAELKRARELAALDREVERQREALREQLELERVLAQTQVCDELGEAVARERARLVRDLPNSDGLVPPEPAWPPTASATAPQPRAAPVPARLAVATTAAAAEPICFIPSHSECCARPSARVPRTMLTKEVEAKMRDRPGVLEMARGGCWSLERHVTHPLLTRTFFLPHAGCQRCFADERVCAAHCVSQFKTMSSTPSSGPVDDVERKNFRDNEREMRDRRGVCANCHRMVQSDEEASPHYLKS
jgi:hypothetical protein